MDDLENYWLRLPIGYSRNALNHYYDDIASTSLGTWQPEVYPLAQHLLNRGNFECLVDIGAGNGAKLDSIDFTGRKVGIDFGSNLDHARANYTNIDWIERDLNLPIAELEFPRNTMFICSDVIEHLDKPAELLKSISVFSQLSGACIIISTPDRDRARGSGDFGPPTNIAHCQEWNFGEFRNLLELYQIPVLLHGHTRNFSESTTRNTQVVIVDERLSKSHSFENSFKVAAIMPVFNEIDIVEKSVSRLISQGLDVYVIDNWSDDGSYEMLLEMADKNDRIKIERFPNAPVNDYVWVEILKRMEDLSLELDYDWFVHVDADEFLEGYTPNVCLKESIRVADSSGYDVIDFTLIDFRPTKLSHNLSYELPNHWEFSTRSGAKNIQRAWKNKSAKPDFHKSGGHALTTHNRLFPFNFLLMHFPIRNEVQAKRKIFRDRLPRFGAEKSNYGWHTQYDQFTPEDSFLWEVSKLNPIEPGLQKEYLPEILGRCNVFPNGKSPTT